MSVIAYTFLCSVFELIDITPRILLHVFLIELHTVVLLLRQSYVNKYFMHIAQQLRFKLQHSLSSIYIHKHRCGIHMYITFYIVRACKIISL